jgi:hypothetical protein
MSIPIDTVKVLSDHHSFGNRTYIQVTKTNISSNSTKYLEIAMPTYMYEVKVSISNYVFNVQAFILKHGSPVCPVYSHVENCRKDSFIKLNKTISSSSYVLSSVIIIGFSLFQVYSRYFSLKGNYKI